MKNMKKLTAMLLALIMLVSTCVIVLPASATAVDTTKATHVYDFTREWEIKDQMAPYSANIKRTFSDEGMTLKAVSSTRVYNSYYLTAMTADLQYVRVKVKNPYTRAGMMVSFTKDNTTVGLTTETLVEFSANTNTWQDVVGATGVTKDTLSNAVATFHLQMAGTFNAFNEETNPNGYVTFEYIAFFATEDEANAFDIDAWRAANPEKTKSDVTSDVPYILKFQGNDYFSAFGRLVTSSSQIGKITEGGATTAISIYGKNKYNNVDNLSPQAVFSLNRMVTDVRYAVVKYKNTSSSANTGLGIGFTSVEGVTQRFNHMAVATIKNNMTEFETIVVDLADETIRSTKNNGQGFANQEFVGRAWGLAIEPLRTVSNHGAAIANGEFQLEYIALFSTEAAANAYATDGTLPANTSSKATGVIDFAAANPETANYLTLHNGNGKFSGADEYIVSATVADKEKFGVDIAIPEAWRNSTYVRVGFRLSGVSYIYFDTYLDNNNLAYGKWRGAGNSGKATEGVWNIVHDREAKTTAAHTLENGILKLYIGSGRVGAAMCLDYIAFFDSETEARSFSIAEYKKAASATTTAIDVYSFDTDRAYEINNKMMPFTMHSTVSLTDEGLNFQYTNTQGARQGFYFDANDGAIPAYIKVRAKLPTAAVASPYMDVCFTSNSGLDSFGAAKFRFNRGSTSPVTFVYDGEFHEYMIPLNNSDSSHLYGGSIGAVVNGFQFLFASTKGEEMVIDYIAFFETEADATTFSIDAWEEENAPVANPGYAGPIVFDYTADGVEDRQVASKNATLEYTESGLKVTSTVDGDLTQAPIVSYELEALATDVRFFKIKYKNGSLKERIQLAVTPYAAANYINTYRTSPTLKSGQSDYLEDVYDFNANNQGGSTFHGYVNGLSIVFFTDKVGASVGDEIEIEYIAFFATEEEAEAFDINTYRRDEGRRDITQFMGVQKSDVYTNDNGDSVYDIRFIAEVSTLKVDGVGFVIERRGDNAKTWTSENTTTVYTALLAKDSATGNIDTVTPSVAGNFLTTLTLNGVPQGEDCTLYARVFTQVGEDVYYGEYIAISIPNDLV